MMDEILCLNTSTPSSHFPVFNREVGAGTPFDGAGASTTEAHSGSISSKKKKVANLGATPPLHQRLRHNAPRSCKLDLLTLCAHNQEPPATTAFSDTLSGTLGAGVGATMLKPALLLPASQGQALAHGPCRPSSPSTTPIPR